MGMVKKSITLTSQQNEWIQSQLSQGRYASDSELLRDLIRKEQEKSNQIDSLRLALLVGERSGLSSRSAEDILKDVLNAKAD
ncbi:type II toxin-antitoxin system ParD family antitoxin [Ningiella sp. W23]|uniref:type II toxin-antitoxin system ParD family antitoxin n=1 Tax=Ningiella sp. W23 TaxID=3023715 RepID=UPI00375712E6